MTFLLVMYTCALVAKVMVSENRPLMWLPQIVNSIQYCSMAIMILALFKAYSLQWLCTLWQRCLRQSPADGASTALLHRDSTAPAEHFIQTQ